MTRTRRRIIALAFVLVFVLTAPALIFYALGYRFNPTKQRIEKTGSLVIDSRPRGAAVTFAGRGVGKKTPTILNTLRVGTYRVRLEKTGYYPWEKTLTVFPGEAALTGQIRLWKQSTPTILATLASAKNLTWSPDGTRVAYTLSAPPGEGGADTLHIRDLLAGTDEEVAQSQTPFEEVRWHSRGDRLLLQSGKNDQATFLLVDLRERTVTDLARTITGKLLAVTEDPRDARRFLVLRETESKAAETTRDFLSLDPQNGDYVLLLSRPRVADATRIGDLVVFTEVHARGTRLRALRVGTSEEQALALLSGEGEYHFIDAPPGIVALLNLHTTQLVLADLDKLKEGIRTINDVTFAGWIDNEDQLLLANDFEVWVEFSERTLENPQQAFLRHGRKELLTRVGQPLGEVRWANPPDAVLVAQGAKLLALELDGRGGRMLTQLAEFPHPVSSFTTNARGSIAFVATQMGSATALYRLELQ